MTAELGEKDAEAEFEEQADGDVDDRSGAPAPRPTVWPSLASPFPDPLRRRKPDRTYNST
ncbi:MAG: hypothetical protein ABW328_04710 [Ilumatobacteraceae bacterium]